MDVPVELTKDGFAGSYSLGSDMMERLIPLLLELPQLLVTPEHDSGSPSSGIAGHMVEEAAVGPREDIGAPGIPQASGIVIRCPHDEVGPPKLREGSYFPSLLEPRRRSERALLAVIQQAYVEGVSTRRVDDLVKALGCEGISKSQVSRICQELDVVVEGFLGRPLDGGPYPYLWLDALTQKVREAGRIVNVSVVVATAVNGEGKREIIGMDVGTSEDGAFWLAFLRSLSARGLSGVELVVSDAHQGLRGAIAAVFGGASWQRCRTHFMTNLLTRVPRRAQPWVATMVRTIYQQPSPDEVRQGDRSTPGPLPSGRLSTDGAGPDILAFSSFPVPTGRRSGPTTHRSQEIRRRTDVVGIFPNRPSVALLAPSWLSNTTNGPSAVDTSHPPF